MKSKPFGFKQFDVYQDKTAMKIGTDGVLLGAYANLDKGNVILDIGAGTGLISLMLAQRFSEAKIEAVEIDEDAFYQAKTNFIDSKFNDRLTIVQSAIQDFNPNKKYDLIVSNPPFFIINDRVEVDSRKIARQQESLSFTELLEKTANLLDIKGSASFIIPFDLESNFIVIAKEFKLYPSKILHIRGNKEALIKRSIIEFSFDQVDSIMYKELIIEIERHQYTADYIALTKDFYLKM